MTEMKHAADEFKVGDYAVLRRSDFVVRLTEHPINGMFGVEFVADYRNGAGVTCGGYTSAQPAELAPITSPERLLLVRVYEARRLIKLAEAQIKHQTGIAVAHEAALRALQDANAAFQKRQEVSS